MSRVSRNSEFEFTELIPFTSDSTAKDSSSEQREIALPVFRKVER